MWLNNVTLKLLIYWSFADLLLMHHGYVPSLASLKSFIIKQRHETAYLAAEAKRWLLRNISLYDVDLFGFIETRLCQRRHDAAIPFNYKAGFDQSSLPRYK